MGKWSKEMQLSAPQELGASEQSRLRQEVIKELGMSLNAYQNLARRTRMPSADAIYSQLNLAGEVGELLGAIAKARRKQEPVSLDLVKKELGDVLWQVSAIADDFGFSLSDVAEHNIAKLLDRADRGVIDGEGDYR
jgi:NTP pyrophosphatase (non-canonical NTP hydrolase)